MHDELSVTPTRATRHHTHHGRHAPRFAARRAATVTYEQCCADAEGVPSGLSAADVKTCRGMLMPEEPTAPEPKAPCATHAGKETECCADPACCYTGVSCIPASTIDATGDKDTCSPTNSPNGKWKAKCDAYQQSQAESAGVATKEECAKNTEEQGCCDTKGCGYSGVACLTLAIVEEQQIENTCKPSQEECVNQKGIDQCCATAGCFFGDSTQNCHRLSQMAELAINTACPPPAEDPPPAAGSASSEGDPNSLSFKPSAAVCCSGPGGGLPADMPEAPYMQCCSLLGLQCTYPPPTVAEAAAVPAASEAPTLLLEQCCRAGERALSGKPTGLSDADMKTCRSELELPAPEEHPHCAELSGDKAECCANAGCCYAGDTCTKGTTFDAEGGTDECTPTNSQKAQWKAKCEANLGATGAAAAAASEDAAAAAAAPKDAAAATAASEDASGQVLEDTTAAQARFASIRAGGFVDTWKPSLASTAPSSRTQTTTRLPPRPR